MKLDVKGQTMISLPQPRNCGRGRDVQLLIYLGPQVLIQQQFQLLVLRTKLGLRGFNVSTPNVKQPKSSEALTTDKCELKFTESSIDWLRSFRIALYLIMNVSVYHRLVSCIIDRGVGAEVWPITEGLPNAEGFRSYDGCAKLPNVCGLLVCLFIAIFVRALYWKCRCLLP